MSHHSGNGPSIDPSYLERMLVKEREHTKTGATGDHPRGKIVPHDEGGIRIAVGRKGDTVVIDFGTPVAWIGFSSDEARALAESLLKHAGADQSTIEQRLAALAKMRRAPGEEY